MNKIVWSAAALSIACGSVPPPQACDARESAGLHIAADDTLNLGLDERPLPTLVRVYQLRNLGRAETASFAELTEHADETLGDAMLSMDEMRLYPDRSIDTDFQRNPDASYVMAVAVVRRPSGNSWRTILELPAPSAQAVCLAMREHPDQPPPATELRLALELDHYQITGAVEVVPEERVD
jgi:type VI secretion system protein VasD